MVEYRRLELSEDKLNEVFSAGVCPFCGALPDRIDYGGFQSDSSEAWQPASCTSCGRDWIEVYVASHVEEVVY